MRHGVSLDVTPADALAIIAGTEEDHGVPEPLPGSEFRVYFSTTPQFIRAYATANRLS
jgi:hypothetical protein